ncbi:MAG: hypothetical protein ACI8Y4_005122 [Candidatus Poriferisodalaceae bacterium]|jgi:hypothetical protein
MQPPTMRRAPAVLSPAKLRTTSPPIRRLRAMPDPDRPFLSSANAPWTSTTTCVHFDTTQPRARSTRSPQTSSAKSNEPESKCSSTCKTRVARIACLATETTSPLKQRCGTRSLTPAGPTHSPEPSKPHAVPAADAEPRLQFLKIPMSQPLSKLGSTELELRRAISTSAEAPEAEEPSSRSDVTGCQQSTGFSPKSPG